VAPGRKTVKPDKTTKYILVARNEAGDTTAEVTIQVGGTTATPIAVYREGESRVTNNQYIDFDQGVVSSDSTEGADFRWEAEARQFVPRNSADGALLSRSFNDIRLADCVSAPYGEPISGIDGSSLITGCYITNEDRYGKFFVSEWDASGNLTIQWVTWTAKK
jgi:hypothetical protein